MPGMCGFLKIKIERREVEVRGKGNRNIARDGTRARGADECLMVGDDAVEMWNVALRLFKSFLLDF